MMFNPTEIDMLSQSSLLHGLTRSEIEAVLAAAKVRQLSDGAFYFMEGEAADQAYFLLSGKIKLGQVTQMGQQVILGYLTPGRVFGIISILQNVIYPVSAQAVGDCRALVWNQKTFNQLMDSFPRIALNAMQIMAGQIREFQNTIRDLSTQRVEQRIARALLRLARQSGRKTEEGVQIDLPLTRQDLAEMTGTTLYSVSRILNDWEQHGLVKSKRQQIVILFPHGLVKIGEDLPDISAQEPGFLQH